jgi:hypothetical protein
LYLCVPVTGWPTYTHRHRGSFWSSGRLLCHAGLRWS